MVARNHLVEAIMLAVVQVIATIALSPYHMMKSCTIILVSALKISMPASAMPVLRSRLKN
jgi:hypothetical protein